MNAIAAALVRADELGGGELVYVAHGGSPVWVASVRELQSAPAGFAAESMTTFGRNARDFATYLEALNSAWRRCAEWEKKERKKRQLALLP